MPTEEFERKVGNLASQLPRAVFDGLDLAAREARDFGRFYSTGNVSLETLSEAPPGLNHPYGYGPLNARGPRGATPFSDDAVINRQTGAFARDWKVESRAGATASLDRGGPVIVNRNEVTDFLTGGRGAMRPRPIDKRVEEYARTAAEAHLKVQFRLLERTV